MKGMSQEAAAKLLADIERSTWQFRAIAATGGNQTRLGMVILAVLGIAPDNAPRLVCPTAVIDEHGMIWSWFQDRGMLEGQSDYVPLCSTKKLRDALVRLADTTGMTDAERKQMFEQVQKWIERDDRAIAEPFQ